MAAVWKYTLEPGGLNFVNMPKGAKLLSTSFQGDNLQIWVLVNPDADMSHRLFFVAGTGATLPDETGIFVGAVFHPLGLVFHLFDHGYPDEGK